MCVSVCTVHSHLTFIIPMSWSTTRLKASLYPNENSILAKQTTEPTGMTSWPGKGERRPNTQAGPNVHKHPIDPSAYEP